MRPRARGKRLSEEWVVPLRSLQDVYEVQLLIYIFTFIWRKSCFCRRSDSWWILSHQKFKQYCLGQLRSCPWSELDGLQPETRIINEQLGAINLKGFLTINSQPAVNGAKSDTPSVGELFLTWNAHFWILFFSRVIPWILPSPFSS